MYHGREVGFALCECRDTFLVIAELEFDCFHVFGRDEELRTFGVSSVVGVTLKVIALCIGQRGGPVTRVSVEGRETPGLGADEVNILTRGGHRDRSDVCHIVCMCLENRVDFCRAHL